MALDPEDIFQGDGAVVVEVGAALGDTAERRWVEQLVTRLVCQANIVGLTRRVRGRRVAADAALFMEQLLPTASGRFCYCRFGTPRRRRHERSKKGHEVLDLPLV